MKCCPSTFFLAAILLFAPYADARSPRHPAASASAPAVQPDESQLLEHGQYTNRRGESVHSPAH